MKTRNTYDGREPTAPEDPWDVLQAAFRSDDRERLRRAIAEAKSSGVQNKPSPEARAELNGLISEAGKRLWMNGRA